MPIVKLDKVLTLAKDVQIKDIPKKPYIVKVTENDIFIVEYYPTLNIEKTASLSIIQPGENVTYTIKYSNLADTDITNVVLTDIYPRGMTFLSASPDPDEGTENTWTIGRLPAGASGTITINMRAPDSINLTFNREESTEGSGFVNRYRKLNTGQDAYSLRNVATITTAEMGPVSSEASVTVSEVRGTGLTRSQHGSGPYSEEEITKLITKNKSITANSSLSVQYRPTTFSLPAGRSIDYNSLWSDLNGAKNKKTGASITEDYRYATNIVRESHLKLDENESILATNVSFQGSGHYGLLKKSEPYQRTIFGNKPIFESSEDYLGSFQISQNFDEYGSNIQSEKNISGYGMVATDKRLKESQRTYEHGTGSYQSDEMIRTAESYISKDITASHGTFRYKLTPNSTWVEGSAKWTEGIWSKTRGTSYLGEKISSADYLDSESSAKGLNDLETKSNYEGKGEFRAVLTDQVDLYEEYLGKYSYDRKIHLTGVSRYDEPHLTVMKEGNIRQAFYNGVDDANIAEYDITVINDGNAALGPVYVKDLFPPGTAFINSSLKPARLASNYANWTLMYISIGQIVNIKLMLNVTDEGNELVNRVDAYAAYNERWITASNFTANQVNWLTCCEPQISAFKAARLDANDPNTVWFRIAIKNHANYTMTARITDWLPEGLRFMNSSIQAISYPYNLSWVLNDIQPGGIGTIDYRAKAMRSGRFTNSAHIETHAVDGSGEATGDVSATVVVGGSTVGKTSNYDWQPPACFDLNCTQQGFGEEWIPCYSCGDAEPQPLDQSLDTSCASCVPVIGGDSDIP